MKKFELWAQMIQTDQMSTAEVIQFMKDHKLFALWYEKKYEVKETSDTCPRCGETDHDKHEVENLDCEIEGWLDEN